MYNSQETNLVAHWQDATRQGTDHETVQVVGGKGQSRSVNQSYSFRERPAIQKLGVARKSRRV